LRIWGDVSDWKKQGAWPGPQPLHCTVRCLCGYLECLGVDHEPAPVQVLGRQLRELHALPVHLHLGREIHPCLEGVHAPAVGLEALVHALQEVQHGVPVGGHDQVVVHEAHHQGAAVQAQAPHLAGSRGHAAGNQIEWR